MNDHDLDQALGIARCVQCGHRLDGDIECQFCAVFPETKRVHRLPKWIYITACFLTSPLSIYFVVRNTELSPPEKVLTLSGSLLWAGLLYI